MRICKEEIFGPVQSIQKFSTVEEAAERANKNSYGLAAAVFTKDIEKSTYLSHALRAGTVWVNCYNVFDAALPFGGYKQSGWGREMGYAAVENYLETKSVVVGV